MSRTDPQSAVLIELEPVVAENLDRHLAIAKEWHPHDYVPWDEGRNFAFLAAPNVDARRRRRGESRGGSGAAPPCLGGEAGRALTRRPSLGTPRSSGHDRTDFWGTSGRYLRRVRRRSRFPRSERVSSVSSGH